METGGAVNVWRKRRGLTAALLILAFVSLVGAVAGLPRTYQSQASVVLLASRSAARQTGGNPYLSFSASLTLTADALSREMMAPAVVQSLAARGYAESYTVTLPADTTATTGSVLVVAVSGSDPASVQRTLRAVVAEVGTALVRIQGAVRPQDEIRVATLSVAPQATLAVSQTARPIVVIAVLGLVGALGVPVLVDGWLTRRRGGYRASVPGRAPDGVGHLV
jgi:hypothetical protein